MKRIALLMMAVIVLASPCALMAQRGGGRGGRSGAGGGQTTAPGTDTTVSGLEEAAAEQATEAQRAQYQAAAKNTDAAKKLAEKLSQGAAKTAASPNYAGQAAELKVALEKVRSADAEFLQSFSKAQASGLKSLIKKLRKADDDVEAQGKTVSRELESAKVNEQKVSEAADRLTHALANLGSQQKALGTEMGM